MSVPALVTGSKAQTCAAANHLMVSSTPSLKQLSEVTANSSNAWASTASSWGDWQAAHQHRETGVTCTGPPLLPSWELETCQQCRQNQDLLLQARRVEGQGVVCRSYDERGRRFLPCFGTGKAKGEISALWLCLCPKPGLKSSLQKSAESSNKGKGNSQSLQRKLGPFLKYFKSHYILHKSNLSR